LAPSRTAFGGRPQRYRHVQADFNGYICELLAKATSQRKLDEIVTREDQEILLQALRGWGALDQDYAYKTSLGTSNRRGYEKDPGGGVAGPPTPSQPLGRGELLRSGLWQNLFPGANYEFQTTLFQPIGGMDMIARAFAREVGDLIRFNAKVKAVRQDARQVNVVYEDTADPGKPLTATADWCLCTIPLSILSQIELSVGAPMQNAIAAVPYAPALKIGLQFKRRFWEQDEGIYGGISYTDLPIRLLGYPCTGYGDAGKAVLLGAYTIFSVYAYEFTSLSPAERVAEAVADGAQIHPQYKEEFENGIAVAWHRNPAVLGCSGSWTDATRKQHYDNLCALDGRILLAGEHASYLPGWQEGALLSSLDAVGRLHRRVLAG
jgi:monoamine oxidase